MSSTWLFLQPFKEAVISRIILIIFESITCVNKKDWIDISWFNLCMNKHFHFKQPKCFPYQNENHQISILFLNILNRWCMRLVYNLSLLNMFEYFNRHYLKVWHGCDVKLFITRHILWFTGAAVVLGLHRSYVYTINIIFHS